MTKSFAILSALAFGLALSGMTFVAEPAQANAGGWFCGGSVVFDAVHDKDKKHVVGDSVFGNLVPCVAGVVAGTVNPVAGVGVGLLTREFTRSHRDSHYPGTLPKKWSPFKAR